MRMWCLGVQPFGVGLVEPTCQTVLAEVSYLGSGRLVAGVTAGGFMVVACVDWVGGFIRV